VLFLFADHMLDTDRRELRRGSEPIVVEPQVFDLLLYLLQKRSRGQQGRSHRFNLGRPDRVGYYPDQSHQERAKRGWRQISLRLAKGRNWRALAIFCSTPCLGSPAWRRGRVRTKKPSAQQYLRTLRTQSGASKPGLSAVDSIINISGFDLW
jgi:hypothetical protein